MEFLIIALMVIIGTPILYAIDPDKFIEYIYTESEDWDND